MYIYFDSNGTIKEIVNDVAIRKGSADYNKLYVYIEGNPEIDDIWYFQKFPNGSTSNEVSFINNVVIKSIPYDAKRDMTYFKDFVQYKFYVFTLTSEYLNISGLAIGTIRIAVDNSIFALGELTFNIQANEVKEDNNITQSQYNYLLLAYASRTLNEYTSRDLENYIDDIINAKVEELNPLQPSGTGTTAYITSQTSDIGILISTDNGHWYYWNGTQYADGGNYQAPFYNSSNKLNADYVDDTNSTHKFVTASEKAQIATNTTAIANRYTKAETNTLLGKKVNYIDFDNSADVTLSNYVYTITGETAEIIKSMNCVIKCTAETFSDMFYPNNFDMVLLPSCIENGLYIYQCVYNTTDYGNNVLYTPFYIEDDVLKAKLTLTINPIDEKSTKGMKLITNVFLSSYGNPIQKRMYFRYGGKNIVNENTYEDFFKIALINGDAVFGGNGTTLDFTATNGQLKNVKLNSNNYHVFNNQEDLVDNLTSNDATKALTAKQGEILKGLIDVSGHTIALAINTTNYQMTAILKDVNGNTISTSNVIDLPLESVVVSGTYDDTTKKVILTLQNGSTIDFSVADLVDGLQPEITSQNKLSSNLVEDVNYIALSKTITSFSDVTSVDATGYLTQAQYDRIDDNTRIDFTITATNDNEAMIFRLKVLYSDSNGYTFGTYQFFENAGIVYETMMNCYISPTNYSYEMHFTVLQLYTKGSVDTALASKSSVVANPTLDGTESNLTGLEVNGVKYAVPSGNSVYVVKSTDITNFTPTPQGNMQVTLSQELEDVILEFKKLVYIDWENQFPALYDNSTKVSLFTPVKFANLDGTDIHTFSCIDGTGDITLAFYQNNGNWYFAKIANQLLTQETGQMLFNTELDATLQVNSAQTVDTTLSQITYKGVTYGVGGGSEVHLYQHNIKYAYSGGFMLLNVLNNNSTPFNSTSLKSYLETNGLTSNNGVGLAGTGKYSDNTIMNGLIIFNDGIKGLSVNNEYKDLNFSRLIDIVVQIF